MYCAAVSTPAPLRRRLDWPLPWMAWLPVGSAILTAVAVLSVTTTRYGYHRDELYFLMLPPAQGYVDQPPLTPYLAHLSTEVFGNRIWALHIPAILCAALSILLTALTTREFGGGRWAQGLSAWGFAFAALPLVNGHTLLTGTVDLAVWAAVLLFVARALLRARPVWYLAAGIVVGLGLYNKLLVVLLLSGLAIGLLLLGPRSVLASRWLWAGVVLAVLIGLPNLLYQASHDWPQLTMARALSENNASDVRVTLVPFQILLIGPPLFVIAIAGFVGLLRRPAWRAARGMALAYPVVLVVSWFSGTQYYYGFGLLAFLFAIGCVSTAEWAAHRKARRSTVVIAVAISSAVNIAITLPVLPERLLGPTGIDELNQGARDSIGWPVYVQTLTGVYRSLPPADQSRAVILTGNYGEAGSVVRYGENLPQVYSGQNELWYLRRPPPSATVVVAWTQGLDYLRPFFASCEQKAVMDNGVGVDNEEQGSVVAVCRDPVGGWDAVWPRLQHYD
jgi:Dolichyl-phosphate-mannose-protein mannosyltransferase